MICSNPNCVEELSKIDASICSVKKGKIFKIAIQFKDDINNQFVEASNAISDKASWDTFLAASDTTTITMSPLLENAILGAQEALENGENPEGDANVVDMSSTPFTAEIKVPSKSTYEAFHKMMCSSSRRLTVYIIYERGVEARYIGDSTAPTGYAGIALSNNTFMAGDETREGTKADLEYMPIAFKIPSGWSDDSAFVPFDGFDAYDLFYEAP